jgi:CDP-diacylglycerol--serine O-phosphatidyltransferase
MLKGLPNLLTLGNLFLGCLAIFSATHGELEQAGYLIFTAAVLDFLDGFVARLLHAQSNLGMQLDSLADVVSFGVAPGFIMARLLSDITGMDGSFHLSVAFLLPVFAAYRLAIFNTSDNQSSEFVGLPTPAMAIAIASLPFSILALDLFAENVWMIYATIVGSSLLMIAPVRMIALKFTSYGVGSNWPKYLLIIGSGVAIVVYGFGAGVHIIVLYLVLSLLSPLSLQQK